MNPTLPPSRTALVLAVVAVAVNGPRLVLAFLEADGVMLAASWRMPLLGLTGVATGVVLTGGGAYLAHALARGVRFRRTLATAWVLVLVCSAVLVTPMLVAGLAREPLAAILPHAGQRWVWAATAVVAIEIVAAGAMVAHAGRRKEARQAREADEQILRLAAERNRLAARVEELSAVAEAAETALAAAASGPEPPRSAPGPAPVAETAGGEEEKPYPCRSGCGARFETVHAERGHQANCRRRRVAPSTP